MTQDTIEVEGTIENVIYQNPENGFTVFAMSKKGDRDKDNETICTGLLPKATAGEDIKVVGYYVTHPSYGKQISVTSFEKIQPTTERGIEKYLASGAIKGIGEKLATKIVKKFGNQTLRIIETEPNRLAEITGISLKKAKEISGIYYEQIELRNITIYLGEHDISPAYALRLYKRYKGAAIEIVKENPYVLSSDIIGVGFKTADKIALKLGVDINSTFRIKAGIRYVLSQTVQNGHVCMEKEMLIEVSVEQLGVDKSLIDNCLLELQMEKTIIQDKIEDKIVVYLNPFFYAENYVAKKLLELSKTTEEKNANIQLEIDKTQDLLDIKLAGKQRDAVVQAMEQGVMVITGGPGTGKTTTINTIITMLKNEGYEIQLAAPTGRAAKRMSEATGMEAKTIHRLLEIEFLSENANRQSFSRNEDNPIEADIIIVDEVSMVDLMLMQHLLKAIQLGTRLILVGDVNQLPSVGAGNVLKDIISSGLIGTVSLDEIFRQARESAIIMNAHRILQGELPILNEKDSDFFFVKRLKMEEVISTLVELYTERLPKYMGVDPKEIQILTPMRKSQVGALNLNQILQNQINKPDKSKKEYQYRNTIFREGDKVMQIKNNYNLEWKLFEDGRYKDQGLGVFNGDEGEIVSINKEAQNMQINFYDGKVVRYDFTQLDELELSYAITIHKSQGSEYKVVIVPVHSGPAMLLNRNLLYTALTRARNLAVFVGVEQTLFKMVENDKEVHRYSFLNRRILKLSETVL